MPLKFERTDRGLKHYEPMRTAYGHELRVYESSSADKPHIWLAVSGEESTNLETGELHVLLTIEQVRRLQDVLSAAIANHYHYAMTTTTS